MGLQCNQQRRIQGDQIEAADDGLRNVLRSHDTTAANQRDLIAYAHFDKRQMGLPNQFNSKAAIWGAPMQIGCQVGESSLLSAAHLLLNAQFPEATYLEGCFGLHLLKEDPATPVLQFGYGGRAPEMRPGPGLGITIDEEILTRWTGQNAIVQ